MAPDEDRGTLFIAGSSSAVPRPGRANSGYLLRSGGSAIAVDFGSGVFSRLRERFDPGSLDAVVISHMHADHFFDIVPLRYAMRYEIARSSPLPVYLPPGGTAVARTIAGPLKETRDFYGGVLDLREYSPDDALRIGNCTISFAPALHYVPAYAMRVEMPGGVFGYSADTAPCATVTQLVTGCNLFLCETALGPRGTERSGRRGHSNASEAGAMAAQARVNHLVLTHYGANADPAALRDAAAERFDGEISVADDGMEFHF